MQEEGYDLLRQIDLLIDGEEQELDAAYLRLRRVLDVGTKKLLSDEHIELGRLFDRLKFLFNKYPFYGERGDIHEVRISCNEVIHGSKQPDADELRSHSEIVKKFIKFFFGIDSSISRGTEESLEQTTFAISGEFAQGPWRCIVTSINKEEHSFTGTITDENENSAQLQFRLEEFELYGQVNTNLIFKSTIELLEEGDELNLLRIYPREDYFVPLHIVYYPDYLINVTSIANSVLDFKRDLDNWYVHYLFNLLKPLEPNPYFLRGNLVNDLLDELILQREHLDYKKWFKSTFKKYPLEYTVFTKTGELAKIDLTNGMQQHFKGLKKALHELKEGGMDFNKVEIEPAFIQPVYGLQGRLDLMYFKEDVNPNNSHLDIIELKTSKVYGGGKFKADNAAQVSLYDLLTRNVNVRGAENKKTRLEGMRSLLYSVYDDDPLRHKQNSKTGDKIAFTESQFLMSLRNVFVQTEKKFGFNIEPENLIDSLERSLRLHVRSISRFDEPDLRIWAQKLSELDEIYKIYLGEFIAFTLQEKWFSKMGNSLSLRGEGYRETWLKSLQQKKDDCSVIADIKIEEVLLDENQRVSKAVFKRDDNDLGNDSFKVGDIVYLIEQSETRFNIEKSLIPCSIDSLSYREVILDIGQPQKGLADRLQVQNQKWMLEHRLFESSFKLMLNNLYTLSNTPSSKIDTILGRSEPRINEGSLVQIEGLTSQQVEAVNGALNAKDYFLIHGVPGSGKTSRVIKNIVKQEFLNGGDILLLAYTNKAADKLSEVLVELNTEGMDIPFFRLGRIKAMAENIQHTALESITAKMESRDEIQQTIDNSRVVISTVAGIPPTHIIFKTKRFRCAVIDEASQILEPTILGLLCKVDKYILVGDHNQLPAISLHSNNEGKLNENHPLNSNLGIKSLRDSYFERMYRRCEANNWKVLAALTGQGRMHEEIMRFPSHVFYGDRLEVLNAEIQKSDLRFNYLGETNDLDKQLLENRIVFIHSPRDLRSSLKTNKYEASLVGEVVMSLRKLIGEGFDAQEEVGIITPFRNQRGAIRQELLKRNIEGAKEILVDTVESFQGSEKNHIIISFSVNDPSQMEMIIEWNQDRTVDRKLNVALTRAKKQLILIGNEAVLSHEKLYGNLVEYCRGNDQFFHPQIELKSIENGQSAISESFYNLFQYIVTEPIKSDPRTDWSQIILGKDKYFNRSTIIEGGRADFTQPVTDGFNNIWSPEDRVLAYCYWNMRIHYHSSKWCYERNLHNISIDHFIDVGCGPGTSSLAFSEIAGNSPSFYLVDISNAMLEKAKEFMDSSSATDADYFNNLVDIDLDRMNGNLLINFSFFFANVDFDFLTQLQTFLGQLASKCDRIIIVNQNSPNMDLNVVWDEFEKHLKTNGFHVLNGSKNVELNYSNSLNSEAGNITNFSYTVLSN